MARQVVTLAPSVRVSLTPAAIVIGCVIFGCACYANLAFLVTDSADYEFFPPFRQHVNLNKNDHLGAEYYNIAQALAAGDGFANPFAEPTGPTAWMPPVMPAFLASVLWMAGGDKSVVIVLVILVQMCVLCGTGVLVLALVRATTVHLAAGITAAIFLAGVLLEFFLWFQFTHDGWLTLLLLDILVAGLCWTRPLERYSSALCWGLLGGLCTLTNPIVALVWGLVTLVVGMRGRNWARLTLALTLAGAVMTPWLVRNYLVFGRWIPVKANLAYELYQSQCLGPAGLIEHPATFATHPYTAPGTERDAYKTLGEMAFLDRKGDLFWQSVASDPLEFGVRMANRFLATTLWYVPFDPEEEGRIPGWSWLRRFAHPLPFLAVVLLLWSARRQSLHAAQWAVIAIYGLYLLPYVIVTYYDRYAMSLIAAKSLLIVWGADRLLAWWAAPAKAPAREIGYASPPAAGEFAY